MFKTIVVGTDGSARAAIAVAHAIALAAQSGGIVHIVSAISPVADPSVVASAFGVASMTSDTDSLEASYREVVDEAAAEAKRQGVAAATHVSIGSPSDVLCDLARRVGADLVVVGNRGMQGALKILGSVPNTVSHHAPCSVLIVDTKAAKG